MKISSDLARLLMMIVSAILVFLASKAWAHPPHPSSPTPHHPALATPKPSVTIIPPAAALSGFRYTPPKGQYQPYAELDPKYQPYVDQALDAIYQSLGIEKPTATETRHVTVVHAEATPGMGLGKFRMGEEGGRVEFAGRGEQKGEVAEEVGVHAVEWDG